MIFSFLIKKSRLKTIEIEISFFHSLGNLKSRTLDYFFYASRIRHNFPYKLILISMRSVEIFLKLPMKNSTSAFNHWDDFRMRNPNARN